jgi:hypothetical protein
VKNYELLEILDVLWNELNYMNLEKTEEKVIVWEEYTPT